MTERPDDISAIIERIFPVERRNVVRKFVEEASRTAGVSRVIAVNMGKSGMPQPVIFLVGDKGEDVDSLSLRRKACSGYDERVSILGLTPFLSESDKEEFEEIDRRGYETTVLWQRSQESATA